jgi:hypothetical protein
VVEDCAILSVNDSVAILSVVKKVENHFALLQVLPSSLPVQLPFQEGRPW